MFMHRCFIEPSWIDRFLLNPLEKLPEEVAHRLHKVVRLKPSETFGLFDGRGRELLAILDKGLIKNAFLKEEQPAKPSITVLQALIEEGKLTETLKRGTEFGADHFLVFEAEKSEPFLKPKMQKRLDRLERVLIDAARQSGRLFVPSLRLVSDVSQELTQGLLPSWGVYGDPKAVTLLSTHLQESELNSDILIAIGPEGGFSDQELKLFAGLKFCGVRFAPFTLRTELAALAALAIINASLGRA